MTTGADMARVASLIGDPARSSMLNALMSGQALTASELALEAGVSAQTASSHLAKLHDGGLLVLRKQGRHKYFALSGEDVAGMLEALAGFAAGGQQRRTRPGPRDEAMRRSRVCYNHLAGHFAVRLYDSLLADGSLCADDGLVLTPTGCERMAALGVDMDALRAGRAPLVRECLDWSERRTHLGGALGRALYTRFEDLAWVRREKAGRTVRFTPEGERAFMAAFPLD